MHISCLFTPATKLAALKPAAYASTKVLVIDLEDAVHLKDKEKARQILRQFDFSTLTGAGLRLGLRTNQLDSIDGIKDLLLLDELKGEGFPFSYIIVTKVNNAAEMQVYRTLFDAICDQLGIVPIIETQDGVRHVEAIAAFSSALILGEADLSATMYAPNKHYLSHARAMLCLAAARYDIMAIDGNSFEMDDLGRLREQCLAAKAEGFTGKAAIHPCQLDPINAAFAVSQESVAAYASLVDLHSQAEHGFSILDQRVIAPPFVKKANKMIELSRRVSGEAA